MENREPISTEPPGGFRPPKKPTHIPYEDEILEGIGIGPVTLRRVLERYSLQDLLKVSPLDLMKIKRVGKGRAKALKTAAETWELKGCPQVRRHIHDAYGHR